MLFIQKPLILLMLLLAILALTAISVMLVNKLEEKLGNAKENNIEVLDHEYDKEKLEWNKIL